MDFKDILKAKSMDTKNDDYQEASIMQGDRDLSEKKDDAKLFFPAGWASPAADVWRKLSDQHYALLQSAEKEYHEKVISQRTKAVIKSAEVVGYVAREELEKLTEESEALTSRLNKLMIQESFGIFQDKKQITKDTIITLEDNSEEMQKKVQEKLFELGYKWWGNFEKEITHYFSDANHYILDYQDTDIVYCARCCNNCPDSCAKTETTQQITAEEFLKDY